jgi:ribosomal 50S subunit-recycling heat shock protein
MEGQRIDVYLAGKFDLTRSGAQKIIENGGLKINGIIINCGAGIL